MRAFDHLSTSNFALHLKETLFAKMKHLFPQVLRKTLAEPGIEYKSLSAYFSEDFFFFSI
jgi:hypothetical protein